LAGQHGKYRQANPDIKTTFSPVLRGNRAAVEMNGGFGNGQTESDAASLTARLRKCFFIYSQTKLY
jgi:hypothetical protein